MTSEADRALIPTAKIEELAQPLRSNIAQGDAMESKTRKSTPLKYVVICTMLLHTAAYADTQNLSLYYGIVTKPLREDRVLTSAISNYELMQIEPLAQSVGCGLILKPVSKSGLTNLLFETSTGTALRAPKERKRDE